MSDIFGEPTSTIRIDLTQNLSALSTSPTVHLTVKARRFELSKLNCDKFNNNCILKEYMLACKNFDLIKKHTHTHTKVSVHWTQLALSAWRQSATGFLWYRNIIHLFRPKLQQQYRLERGTVPDNTFPYSDFLRNLTPL